MNISDVNKDGIAMDGMDPVSYFNGEGLQGTAQYSFMLGNYTYQFANAENQQLFEKDPAKYIPLAGGYTSEKMVGDINQLDEKFVGNKTFTSRDGLEDNIENTENNVPMDIKEDGDVEMQNLHDSNN